MKNKEEIIKTNSDTSGDMERIKMMTFLSLAVTDVEIVAGIVTSQ